MSLKSYIKSQQKIVEVRRWLKAGNAAAIATRCLFCLNRHARGIERGITKRTIYNLKNHLVRWLWQNGYCVSHSRQRQTLECWHTHDYNYGYDDWCEKCGNTGIYAEHILHRFVFKIGDTIYVWHQPDQFVDWLIEDDGKWTQDLNEYRRGGLEHVWLDKPVRLLYVYTVWQFLRMQGVEVDIPRITLKQALSRELSCGVCKGRGYTEKQRWNGTSWNTCYRCLSMGCRFRWVNRLLFWRERIYASESLHYDFLELPVPFFIGWLEAIANRGRDARPEAIGMSEDEIPF